MKIKQEILNRSITHEQHMHEVLKDEDFQQMFFVKKGFQPKIQDIEKARSILNIPTKNQRLINYNKAN